MDLRIPFPFGHCEPSPGAYDLWDCLEYPLAWCAGTENLGQSQTSSNRHLMQSNYIPTKATYNTIKSLATRGEPGAANKAESILLSMLNQYHHAGNRGVKPSTNTFNAVINSCNSIQDTKLKKKKTQNISFCIQTNDFCRGDKTKLSNLCHFDCKNGFVTDKVLCTQKR